MPRTPDIPADIPADLQPRVRARLATIRRAERDPIMGRVCSVCGRRNYTIVRQQGHTLAEPLGFVSFGGRWYCADCAPRHCTKTRTAQLLGDEPGALKATF